MGISSPPEPDRPGLAVVAAAAAVVVPPGAEEKLKMQFVLPPAFIKVADGGSEAKMSLRIMSSLCVSSPFHSADR